MAELERFGLGDLPDETLETIAQHVAFCAACEQRLGRLSSCDDRVTMALRAQVAPPAYDEAELARVVRQIDEVSRTPAPPADAQAPDALTSSIVIQPMPREIEPLVRSLLASGLIGADELTRLRSNLPSADPGREAEQLALELVRCGKLTRYQAAVLYQQRRDPLVLGEYVVLDRIGAGGMGQVFKARHGRMDRLVAIKLVSPSLVDAPEAVDRFQREVRAVARLEHANIVTAFDAGELDGTPFLVMQLVDGSDLSSVVKQRGPLAVPAAIECIRQAAKGLAYAHRKGVIHRDVKPSNMLLDADGTIKILDLGLARFEDAGDGLTCSDQVMGSIDYMSPEQAVDSRQADARSDIYSLGCTLWHLLSGRKLYQADTPVTRILRHREAPIPSLCQERDDVPAALDGVFRKLVAKQPADRYQSMDEVAAALEQLQAQIPSQAGQRSKILAELHAAAAIAGGNRPVEPTAEVKGPPPAIEATASYAAAEVETDPTSEWVVPRLAEQGKDEREPVPHGARRHRPRGMLMAGASLLGLIAVLGLIVALRLRPAEHAADVRNLAASRDRNAAAPSSASPQLAALTPGVRPSPIDPPDPLVAPFDAQQAHAGQEAWAKYLNTGVEQTNSIGMTLVLIPPGEFMMGSAPEQAAAGAKLAEDAKLTPSDYLWTRLKEEGPQHRVAITKPYWLGATEVTIGQFKKFVEATGYVTEAEQFGFGNSSATNVDDKVTPEMKKITWRAPGYPVTDDSPVTQITWNDCIVFCNWLSEQEKLQPCYQQDANAGWELNVAGTLRVPSPRSEEGRDTRSVPTTFEDFGYRLPTEAEWEYACRAGTTTQFSFGDDPAMLDIYGWFNKNAGESAHPVGSKAANPFGLFDMHGNVYEWCHDFYAADYYSKSPPRDPVGPSSGRYRVSRGGFWCVYPVCCRSAFRYPYKPALRHESFGFRVLRGK
jgi:formylglycine-generating enzyme required for sulfatase activity